MIPPGGSSRALSSNQAALRTLQLSRELCYPHGDNQVSITRRALVLAGGGYAASAWEIGLIAGMADAGVDIRNADLLVGTSSGARVALHLASGLTPEEIFQGRIRPNPQLAERPTLTSACCRQG
jgi:predicted acylesterase/phospholipase RssA